VKASRRVSGAADGEVEVASGPAIFLGALGERDIDLLLVEEAYSCPKFLQWLAAALKLSAIPSRLLEARVSTFQATGESDIEIWFEDNSGKVTALLIENKIDANFQPDQALRYSERGKTYVRQGRCFSFKTALVAPRIYLDRSSDTSAFEAQISYESLIVWFQKSADTSANSRAQFKVCQLARAIEKAQSGYCSIEDAAVTAFWKESQVLAASLAPELQLPEISGKPARALWIRYKVRGFGGRFAVIYKMDKGMVDFQIPGRADDFLEIRSLLAPLISDGMEITTAGESLVLRRKAPIVAPGLPFAEQRQQIAEGLLIAKSLLDWISLVNLRLRKALASTEHFQ
jgi:hypothetical protein